ncbi:DUF6538 domain-containing protein [Gluconobacter thailandicus]|nr:DUF6538 domain-containing protein [Gluconobacter thailandicus]
MSHCMSFRLSANIFRRGDQYAFRVRVPVLVPFAQMRRELVFSLRTDNRRMALTLAATIRLRLDSLWMRLNEMNGTKADLEKLVKAWFYRELNEAQRLYMSGDLMRGTHESDIPDLDDLRQESREAMGNIAEHKLEMMTTERQRHDFSRGYAKAREVLTQFGIPFQEHDQRFTALAKHYAHIESLLAETQLRWSQDDLDYMPNFPILPEGIYPDAELKSSAATVSPKILPPIQDSPIMQSSPQAAGLLLSEAFERYAVERKPKLATVKGYRASVRRFIDLQGDMDVAHINKKHIAAFKDALLQFPAVLKVADRALTTDKIIERYKSLSDARRLSAGTINAKHISGVSVALQWASENGYVDTVVSRGVRAKGQRQKYQSDCHTAWKN